MNAAPVIQVSVHLNVTGPASGSTTAGAAAVDPGQGTANNSTFAGALQDAGGSKAAGASKDNGAKSAHKSAAGKTADDARPGDGLPVAGNQPPPAPPSVPQGPLSAAALQQAAAAAAASAANAPPGASADVAKAGDGTATAPRAGANLVAAGGAAGAPAATLSARAGQDSISGSLIGLPRQHGTIAAPSPAAETAAAAAQPSTLQNASSPNPSAASKPVAALSAPVGSIADQSAAQAHVAALRPAAKVAAREPGTATLSGTNSTKDSAAGAALASTAATTLGGIAQAAEAAISPVPADSAAVPATATAAAATASAATGAAGASAVAAATPQAAKFATATASDSSFDSDAAVGAPNIMGERGATGPAAPGAAAALSVVHGDAGSASAQSAASLLVNADNTKHPHAGTDLSTLGGNSADAAAGLSQLANSPVSAPAAAAPTATLNIHASVDGSDFPQGLSDRVSWMVGNGVNGAKLQVNPPQLGPIELRISIQANHAQVWMTTHSAVTRDALESSSPKLREMLGAQGFGQVSVDISQRSFQDRSTYTPPYQRASTDRSAVAAPAVSIVTGTMPRTSLGALDAYA